MSRVTHLGPIDLESRFNKPPEPPIFIGACRRVGLTAWMRCSVCRVEGYPRDYWATRGGSPPPLQMDLAAFARVELVGAGHEVEYRTEAYIGQCGRCQRIYVALITPG